MLDFPNAEVKNGFVSGNIFNNTAFPTLNHFIAVVIKTKMWENGKSAVIYREREMITMLILCHLSFYRFYYKVKLLKTNLLYIKTII